MMARFRRYFSVNRGGKKSPLRTEKMNCCNGCKQMDLPWYRVDEEIKYIWKKLKLSQYDAKPCICWSGPLGESKYRKKELEIMKDFFVQTKFSRCNDKIKIEFVCNGDAVRNIIREDEKNFLAEQKRLAAIQREELEKQNLQRLKEILLKWEQDHNFPSSEQKPLTSNELELQSNQSLAKSEYRGIPQIYILKFPKLFSYYVGATTKGYPKRVTEHCEGSKSKITADLEYDNDNWKKNLLFEIMEIIQPLDKKCGWCNEHANVLEFWMQERLREANLSHHSRGTDTALLHGVTCKKCNDFAEKYNIPWKS
jgi:hypothetical protein